MYFLVDYQRDALENYKVQIREAIFLSVFTLYAKFEIKLQACKLKRQKGLTQNIRGIRTLDFSRKTTNAVLSDLQIVDVIK